MEVAMYDIKGKESGKVSLPGVFETKASSALLHEVVVGYMANQRAGTHSTKTRAEVRGGGVKPWREKGTGRARAGSIRSPLWRKGGIIFGPKPHSYTQKISKKKRRLALGMAFGEKARSNGIIVVDNIALDEPKTKNMVQALRNLNINAKEKTLILINAENLKLTRASRNIPHVLVTRYPDVNAYQVLWADKVILSSDVVDRMAKAEKS
jgi:large subunit ribosomal protein L4